MAAPTPRISTPDAGLPRTALRHVTIFFSDLAGFSEMTRRLGDVEATRVANRMLTLQEIVITRDGAGQILQFGGDSVFAVFDNASAALNRALEIQRLLDPEDDSDAQAPSPRLRIGLHMGEVLFKDGERMEIISRHINRAHRVMEAAAPGQILASEVVVDAAKDFIDVPREFLAIRHYGEFYLKGVGATALCEIADRRFHEPQPPLPAQTPNLESALVGRLELAGYRAIERLGEGAHGVVYKAEEESTGRAVAVKVLNPALCEDAAARQRFAREVERTRQLQAAGVAAVLTERLDHQPPFFVMELVQGKPLDEALVGATSERIAEVFRRICGVLGQAHAAGILHCDLKPGNILVKDDGAPVVLDFGMALLQPDTRATKTPSTSLMGTPAFLAPEVIAGAERGPYTDVYALGALLFKVLTGHEPFEGESVHKIVQAHLHEDPPVPAALRPDVADGLQRICLKALEKRPAERYADAHAMAADLERFLRGEVVRTRPTVYDNLLFHRVQSHVEQIRDWAARGLLSADEAHRLLGSYDGLQRRGLPAVMEGRRYRLWQTLVYVGGWAVINGALLWLLQHWDELSRAAKLTLGSVPAITAFALAGTMWRLERFRLTFVALVVGVLATPLLTGVWLHEFKVAAVVSEAQATLQLFRASDFTNPVTNPQLLIVALVTVMVAACVMFFTRTTTHSAQTVLAAALFYSTCLLWFGLRPDIEHEKWATLSVKCVPLLLLLCGGAELLLREPARHYQAPPWTYAAALLTILISGTVSLFGFKEWTDVPEEVWKPLSFLMLSFSGALLTVLGLLARNYLQHRSRLAGLTMISIGILEVLGGLAWAGQEGTWPATWWHPMILGQAVPAAHLALPLASLVITMLACRYQMILFLLVGLAGTATSIHLLGHLYFRQVTGWPKAMMIVGTVCFFTALFLELRRTRGNHLDDVVTEKRL